MSEMPGITPAVAGFGRKVAAAGLTAVMPHLFGEDGRAPTGGYTLSSLARRLHQPGVHRAGPRADQPDHRLAAGPGRRGAPAVRRTGRGRGGHVLHRGLRPGHDGRRRGGGPGAQPALGPVPGDQGDAATTSGSPRPTSARVQERAAAGTCVLGLRFTGDKFSPPERFEHLRELLGDAFVGVELDSSEGNPHGHKKAGPLGAHRGPRRPARHARPATRSTRSSSSSRTRLLG